MLISDYWLDVSADDILAAEIRRLEWEDDEDFGDLDIVASCTWCGDPCRYDFDMRVYRTKHDQILCPACERRVWDQETIETMPPVPSTNGVKYDIDWDLAIKRVTP